MSAKMKQGTPLPRITVGLPDIQDQIRLIDRLSRNAADDGDRGRLKDLAELLSEVYAQFQHRKQITIHRFLSRTQSKYDLS